jgi:hypothetical protein
MTQLTVLVPRIRRASYNLIRTEDIQQPADLATAQQPSDFAAYATFAAFLHQGLPCKSATSILQPARLGKKLESVDCSEAEL